MRERLTLQVYTYSQNDYGEKTAAYTDLATVWGSVEYKSASDETQTAERVTAEQVVVFRIRYRATFLNEKNRILYRGDHYNIRSILPDAHRMYLTIEAINQLT